jgi:hypothetical protein
VGTGYWRAYFRTRSFRTMYPSNAFVRNLVQRVEYNGGCWSCNGHSSALIHAFLIDAHLFQSGVRLWLCDWNHNLVAVSAGFAAGV